MRRVSYVGILFSLCNNSEKMMRTHPGWIDNVVLHGMLKNDNTFEVVNAESTVCQYPCDT